LLASLVVVGMLAGCIMPPVVAPAPVAGPETMKLYIGPAQVDCVGVGPMKCLLARESPDAPYTLFYDSIEGFTYEAGFNYELGVTKTPIANPPADASNVRYTLNEVVAKTPAGEVSTLYVAPMMVECETTEIYQCLLVADDPTGEFKPFYGKINGFTFEEGTMSQLLVEQVPMEQPPADAPAGVWNLLMTLATESQQDVLAPAAEPLGGVLWVLETYTNSEGEAIPVLKDTEITATFQADKIVGSAGCNNYTAEYKVDGDKLSIGEAASTMMACTEPEGVAGQESAYLASLASVSTFAVEAGKLTLFDAQAQPLLIYTGRPTDQPQGASEAVSLEGPLWTLSGYANTRGGLTGPVEGSKVTAIFQDGRLSGNASCNTYGADYTVDGNQLTIGLAITTMMMCEPQDVMQQEQTYLAALAQVAAYQIDGDTLTLVDANGTVLLVYTETAPLTLTGVTWTVTTYNNGKQAVVSLLADTELTLIFGEDGSVSGSAGCNQYTGGYTVDGSAIKIGPLAATMMMCGEPEGVMEQEAQYLAALQAATTFAIPGDVLELRDDSGALMVSAVAQTAEALAEGENTPLEGTLWVLTSYVDAQGEAVEPVAGSEVTANFQDGRLGGNASCNNYGADYTVDGNNLTIGLAVTTMMLCQPEEVAQQEQAYLAALAQVATYQIDGDTLTLADAEGNTLLTFAVSRPAPLTGTKWQVGFYNNGLQALVSPIAGTEITMLFDTDGMLSGATGCNNFSGPYTVNDKAIQIGPLATTRMFCADPEGVMEQETAFIAALESAASFSILGDELELLNAQDARAVTAYAQAPIPAETAGATENIVGETWVWQGTSYGNDTELQPDTPGAYTLELLTDGQALVRADCNSVAGTYTLDEGGAITLSLLAEGLSDCGETSTASKFLADLAEAAIVSLTDTSNAPMSTRA
jgi:heat shock protein HslJ